LPVALVLFILLGGCAASPGQPALNYPVPDNVVPDEQEADCEIIDYRLRQIDSIRWSLREDGAELETEFEQLLQLSVATAATIAIAVPLITVFPDPTLLLLPIASTYSAADRLKQTDAVLIALMVKREERGCPAHLECRVGEGADSALSRLAAVRTSREAGTMTEKMALAEVTGILDGLCPVGDRFVLLERAPAPDSPLSSEEIP
jgi:hypothetical protein